MNQIISHEYLTVNEFRKIFLSGTPIEISRESLREIENARQFLDTKIQTSVNPIYGINTGFGSLCKEIISPADLEQLQNNLVRSHACGIGQEVPEHIGKLIFLLKIRNFLSGHSGVSPGLATRLVELYNLGFRPVIFEKGSLGASGDLVPLAHLALMLLGEGEVNVEKSRMTAKDAMLKFNLNSLNLKAKEGLALLNGTQFMLAYGLDSVWRSQQLIRTTVAVCGMAMDAFDCRTDFLHEGIHRVRPHSGQIWVAESLRNFLKTSQIANRDKNQVQDPYSVRCIPQVLGASKDAIDYVTGVMETELNSITDNPTLFPEEDLVISGGNFHGQPLALALDFLAIAMAEVANISERLLYKLLGGERGLPAFLTQNPGLESGFMIPQYAAAALVSENKQLATPASVDSIVSSNGQEDHVSMGANAALKCSKVIDNVESVLGVLLLAAAQALEFRRPLKTGNELEGIFSDFRKNVDFRNEDRVFKPDMDAARIFIQQLNLEF